MNIKYVNRAVYLLLITVFCLTSSVWAEKSDWTRKDVDWLAGPGGKIKGIRYPEEKDTADKPEAGIQLHFMESADSKLLSNVIDSPPIAGFVPFITVAVTNKRSDDIDWASHQHMLITGSYLTDNPEMDFSIGLFDTGASAHILGYAAAQRTGVYASNLLTPNIVGIVGATNSIYANVSQPLGIFMDGLAAIDPNTMLLDDSNMVGQSNVSVIVGDIPEPNQPDLPTVVGSPMSVYFVTAIFNDNPVSVIYDGNNYTGPDIKFYSQYNPEIPEYANKIPLNLKPAGAADVQYFPDLDALYNFIFQPGSPSVIGSLLQSLFFLNSVDLYNGNNSALDRDSFMLDTGAQITIISSNVAARLGLNPAEPDFEVEIQDVTGAITIEPAFYINALEIAALGEWPSFTNIPVVMLDVDSPEGGFLDGIIGMNLFTEFNLVLRGGGLFGQSPPSLTFERIQSRLIADIAPPGGDGIVDYLDLVTLADSWLATPGSPSWNPEANIGPRFIPDSIINFYDFAEMAHSWLDTVSP